MTRPADLPLWILRGLPLDVLILLSLREQLRLRAAISRATGGM